MLHLVILHLIEKGAASRNLGYISLNLLMVAASEVNSISRNSRDPKLPCRTQCSQ